MKSHTKTHVGWLSSEQAAVYLGFVKRDGSPDVRRFYNWRTVARPRTHRLGRLMRFRQVDLDACVAVDPVSYGTPLHLVAR